jgi:hypothetical protein
MILLPQNLMTMRKGMLVFALATLLLTSCKKTTPKEIAHEWLTAFYHMNFEEAKKYSTEETKLMLTTIEGFSSSFADSIKQNARKVNVTIKSVKEEGDKAYVTFSASNDPNATEPPLKLVKQNDVWLVQFTKSDFKPEETQDEATQQGGVSINVGAPMPSTDTNITPGIDSPAH